ncbi:MAG: hypothetical protein M3081_01970 [Gemmatimonadota bacterium]|nr:hypothetical protein [Gemmatimonadota bacterium]
MTRFLYGVGSSDVLVLGATSLVMIAVGALASFISARRAVRVDPLLALRLDT